MSVEAKESDGGCPVFMDVTPQGNTETSGRSVRLKRLPEELRTGDYASKVSGKPLEEAPHSSSKRPRLSDDDHTSSEAGNLDLMELDEGEFEVSGTEAQDPTSRPAAAKHPVAPCTALEDTKTVQQDRKGDGAATGTARNTSADPIVKMLQSQLREKCARHEELMGELARTLSRIKMHNKKVEALHGLIDRVGNQITALNEKLS